MKYRILYLLIIISNIFKFKCSFDSVEPQARIVWPKRWQSYCKFCSFFSPLSKCKFHCLRENSQPVVWDSFEWFTCTFLGFPLTAICWWISSWRRFLVSFQFLSCSCLTFRVASWGLSKYSASRISPQLKLFTMTRVRACKIQIFIWLKTCTYIWQQV